MSRFDLRARPIYHHKRESIEAHLSIVMAALAVGRLVEQATGWSINRFVKALRPCRTITIQAGEMATFPDRLRDRTAPYGSPASVELRRPRRLRSAGSRRSQPRSQPAAPWSNELREKLRKASTVGSAAESPTPPCRNTATGIGASAGRVIVELWWTHASGLAAVHQTGEGAEHPRDIGLAPRYQLERLGGLVHDHIPAVQDAAAGGSGGMQ